MTQTDGQLRLLRPDSSVWSPFLRGCLGLLPYTYFMFISLFGLLGFCCWQTYNRPKEVLSLLYRRGFLGLAILMIISSSFAFNTGEAYLQLAHFLPFFWVWSVFVVYLETTEHPWQQIHRWAVTLVLVTLPVSLFGIAEYVLKRSFPSEFLAKFAGLYWFYIGDINHLRTFSLFDYPNTLANYLVMILGLNMGLLAIELRPEALSQMPRWCKGLLIASIPLTLACLYCSGSRNGYLVAVLLLLVSLVGVKLQRWMRSLILAGLALMAFTAMHFGIGQYSLSWAWIANDPRVHVWGLALRFIRERPILGYGLGNYKLLYDGEVPGYDFIAHAHNLWLMLASGAGVPVAIAFTLLAGVICYRAMTVLLKLRRGSPQYGVLLAYFLCFMASTLFSLLDVTIFEVRVNLLGWLSLAVLYSSFYLSRVPLEPPAQ